jgi:hypothetical protein
MGGPKKHKFRYYFVTAVAGRPYFRDLLYGGTVSNLSIIKAKRKVWELGERRHGDALRKIVLTYPLPSGKLRGYVYEWMGLGPQYTKDELGQQFRGDLQEGLTVREWMYNKY